jgi:hypothetical protein
MVVAWIALGFGVFGTVVSAWNLTDRWRFRRPLFDVLEADFPVMRHAASQTAFIKSGMVKLQVRGARRPVTITQWQVMMYMRDDNRTGAGTGQPEVNFTIPPFVWTPMELPQLAGMGLPPGTDPPPTFKWEIFLSNPRDVFIVDLNVTLTADESRYYFANWGRKLQKRTIWRRRMPKRLRRILNWFGS